MKRFRSESRRGTAAWNRDGHGARCGNTATTFRAATDAGHGRRADAAGVHPVGYAAVWQSGGPAMAGLVVVDADALELDGAGGGRQATRQIPYASIASARLGRADADRIGGRPVLMLGLADGEVIRIATPELGALHELEEALRNQVQRDLALVDDGAVLGR